MMEKNQIFENIMSRTSVRSYTDMPPLAIVVCGCLDKTLTEQEFWIQDCSAATENILLQATDLGLGAVWCGIHPQKKAVERVSRLLGMTPRQIPLNIIYIGYPAETPEPRDQYAEKNIHWVK